jgi:hypothetical protein
MLVNLYEDADLTSEQLTQKNNLIDRMKNVYTPDVCLGGMNTLVDLLENVLVPYYTAKGQVDAATTVEDALNVTYK